MDTLPVFSPSPLRFVSFRFVSFRFVKTLKMLTTEPFFTMLLVLLADLPDTVLEEGFYSLALGFVYEVGVRGAVFFGIGIERDN